MSSVIVYEGPRVGVLSRLIRRLLMEGLLEIAPNKRLRFDAVGCSFNHIKTKFSAGRRHGSMNEQKVFNSLMLSMWTSRRRKDVNWSFWVIAFVLEMAGEKWF